MDSLTQSVTMNGAVRKTLKPFISRALQEGVSEFKVPSFESYSAKITVTNGGALFDVYDPDRAILTINAIAWTEQGQTEVWEAFEPFYLRQARDLEILSVLRSPIQPDRLPWLASFVYPNPAIQDCGQWLASFEQSVSVVLIEMATARKSPKGFGK
jgi:hypothetical protein